MLILLTPDESGKQTPIEGNGLRCFLKTFWYLYRKQVFFYKTKKFFSGNSFFLLISGNAAGELNSVKNTREQNYSFLPWQTVLH